MRKTRIALAVAAAFLLLTTVGCVSVKAPERIDIGGGSSADRVDSSRVPNPQTMDEARYELRKAYGEIQRLERKVDDLKDDKEKYKRERDQYKDRLEKYEDD